MPKLFNKKVDTSKIKSAVVEPKVEEPTTTTEVVGTPKKVETPKVEGTHKVTFVREGLSGEYIFAEISGSISARSLEEAYQKADELVTKFPAYLNK